MSDSTRATYEPPSRPDPAEASLGELVSQLSQQIQGLGPAPERPDLPLRPNAAECGVDAAPAAVRLRAFFAAQRMFAWKRFFKAICRS